MYQKINNYLIQSDSELKELIAEAVREVIPEIVEQLATVINNLPVPGNNFSGHKEILNLKDTCKLLGGKSPQYVRKLMRSGELPFFKSKDSRIYQIRRIDVLNSMQKLNAHSESPFYKKLNSKT